MDNGLLWAIVLGVLGIAIPVFAFVWEFVLSGRKRLGYRVQMDTSVSDADPGYAGVLENIRTDTGDRLAKPSILLLRVENAGVTTIEQSDYAVTEASWGVQVKFPRRKVAGMAVTEVNPPELEPIFTASEGLNHRYDDSAGSGIITCRRCCSTGTPTTRCWWSSNASTGTPTSIPRSTRRSGTGGRA
ncbi:hypothetical protein ACFQ1S_03825 [Kibdelosporangium lantanae]|uniref:DUF3592 domain-containing protein n=1 Tax=Kibdelosporangium lantanae TaxID=1497396 RepID=A0ABW3M456_9PSEU